jgi:hypothetical protein
MARAPNELDAAREALHNAPPASVADEGNTLPAVGQQHRVIEQPTAADSALAVFDLVPTKQSARP